MDQTDRYSLSRFVLHGIVFFGLAGLFLASLIVVIWGD